MVASSSRRSAVAIAAVLISERAANSADSPMTIHTPHAPLVPERADVPQVLGAGLDPRRRGGSRRSASSERAAGAPPATRIALVGACAVRAGRAPGRARRRRGPRRGRRSRRRAADRASCPSSHAGGTASPTSRSPSAATTRLTATRVAAARRAGRRARRPGRACRRAPGRRGRPPATGRPSPSGRCRAGTPRVGSTPVARVDARQPRELRGRAGRQWRAVAPGDHVGGLDPRARSRAPCRALGARWSDALGADQHRDQQDRRRERGAAPAVGGQARCSRAGPARRAAAAGTGAARPGRPSSQRPSSAVAGREQDRREDRERGRLLAGEQQRHRGAAAEATARRPACARRPAGRARPRPRAAPRPGARARRAAPPRRPRAARCRCPCRAPRRAGSRSSRARSPAARRRGRRAR